MAHSSTVQVLKVVNEMREKKDKSGSYPVRLAVVSVLLDNGDVEAAGNLRLSEALAEGLVPGTYRAGFSIGQVGYGDNRGDIVSQLVSLTPVPTRNPAAAAAAAKAA
jgi:hypothetical protein